MRTVAFVPIRFGSTRLKNKNILDLAGRPLCSYVFNSLLKTPSIDEVYVFCSDQRIMEYVPEGVKFLRRDSSLDSDETLGLEIYQSFANLIDADIYVLAHATSPFTSVDTFNRAVLAVATEGYDSSFTVKREQTFAWYCDQPLNYFPESIPRTQDLNPVLLETSALFAFKRKVLVEHGRRIGFHPLLIEVKGKESIDIDWPEDYELAKLYANI